MTMTFPSEDVFARMLKGLEGQDFEDQVCAFLRSCVTDFQTVPALPHGDAGLDGHSHSQTTAYCCYGPEDVSKSNAKKLKSAIVSKFCSDLRRLFEIDTSGAGKAAKLVYRENPEMQTILAPGAKLKVIRLIVSVYDSHQVLSPLNEAFAQYLKASKLRYIDKSATMTIWGPKQLATVGAVDDLTIARLEKRDLLRRVAAAISSAPPLPAPASDFEAKFLWMESQKMATKQAVARMMDTFRKRWSVVVAVENDLSNNSPNLHAALAQAREDAALDADIASGTCTSPQHLLEVMRGRIGERLDQHLGRMFPPDIKNQLVDGELARLLGECPVEWRPV